MSIKYGARFTKQSKLMWECKPIKVSMGEEMFAADLMTMHTQSKAIYQVEHKLASASKHVEL